MAIYYLCFLRVFLPIAAVLVSTFVVMLCTEAFGEPPGPFSNEFSRTGYSISQPLSTTIWQTGVGEGFRSGTQSIGLGTGVTFGVLMFGGEQRHDLALSTVSYGYMLGDVKGVGHWYRGNWELRLELMGGAQFQEETSWVVALAPHLRYNFATGTRWVPYVDAGAGIALTGIREPDLGGTFEFNLQAATGFNWFISDKMAISIEGRYLHISCAGLHNPNNGVNTVGIIFGTTWFF